MNVFWRVVKLVKPYWAALTVSIITSLIYVAFNSSSIWLTASFTKVLFPGKPDTEISQVMPIVPEKGKGGLNETLKNYTNRLILRDTPLGSLKSLCLLIFLTFLLKNVFLYIKNVTIGFVQLRMINDVRNKLYEHLHDLSLSFFNRKRSGEITSIIMNDVTAMRNSFTVSFDKLLVEPINILTFMVLLFIISWQLALLAVVILPVSGFIISKIGKSIRRKSLRSSRQIAGIMAILDETLQGMRVVKAFAMEKFEIARFHTENRKYFNLIFRRKKLREFSSPINEVFGVLIGVLLLWFGGSLVLTGRGIDAEDFVRFAVMLFAIMTPIKSLTNVSMEMQEGLASAQRVFSLLDEKPDIVEKPNAIEIKGFNDKIIYDNVSFKYETSRTEVLSGINLEIKKGEIVAIVGHSGAGKSTLVDLLPRFYDPTSGRILIDSYDIRDLTFASLRSLMGIVTQHTILFNDTIFNNIAYGMKDFDPEKVRAAAEAANALEFIDEFPDKFETMIGDKGLRLSGGQRQRLAIARALLKNPPILILDEATSSLDSESEQKVQAAIERLMQNRTVLVIAHRLSTIQNADKIVVLERGQIVETGTHSELLNREDSVYRTFYETQFAKNE
ncbi:MAG TPA: ABC transporter transmembrane domain-containing protein [Candidatus Marinimicrobia bacterium]|nr:ABC transporter transmembrane domain-containing protein [Candidatus Neomarinimicrobiota bacterium]HRS52009.1 ABC transporter transmembrane domain-containing protein [Candidatus Neomarinimicrobiota bacterium]HRU91862.1 ABC transporter transmembrane domain-containing protein [Candidatus Neomarinimicrobiota bacterium]